MWSTRDGGALCPACGRAVAGCVCRAVSSASGRPNDGVVRVSRAVQGRKGKGVTLVTGVPLPARELPALCKELKRRCGSGGTVKDGAIELQGDHRDLVVELLAARGWTVKRAGG